MELGLCCPCRGQLVRLDGSACTGCARPLAGAALPGGYLCGTCRSSHPSFDRLLAGWSFEPPFDQVIHGLKFTRLDYLGAHLARALYRRFGPEVADADLVVPVPLHWRRRITRGYNQAEEIARPFSRLLSRPLRRALKKVRAAPPQTCLDRRHRRSNVRGVFRATLRSGVDGCHVILVDDVTTTGSTLEAAAAELKNGGALTVTGLVAGRTPDHPREGQYPKNSGLF